MRMDQTIKNRGVRVTMAAVGINLALGILYTWSVFSKLIPDDWGWNEAEKSLPYAVACLVFSLSMVPAGRLQDYIGPRIVATFGGLAMLALSLQLYLRPADATAKRLFGISIVYLFVLFLFMSADALLGLRAA